MLSTGVLYAPVSTAELVCRMYEDPAISCGAPGLKFVFARWKLSGEDDASDFANDVLKVIQSARRWLYPGYLYFNALYRYLENFSCLTKGKSSNFKQILNVLVYKYVDTWPMSLTPMIGELVWLMEKIKPL